jgi:two-component system, NarL family, nitrate/nitrite response regulator NarL
MTETALQETRIAAPGQWVCAVLAENEVLLRELAVALRRSPSVGAVHQCRDRAEAERALHAGGVDVLVLTGLDAPLLRAAGRAGARPRTLLVLDEAQAADPGPLADLALDGFVLRQQLSARSLHDALQRMRAGEVPMPSVLARQLLGRAGDQPAGPRPLPLTARETETLGLLAEGLSNKQIARRLRISEHGVKRLVGSLLLKLGSPNRTTAVVTAMRSGLIASL